MVKNKPCHRLYTNATTKNNRRATWTLKRGGGGESSSGCPPLVGPLASLPLFLYTGKLWLHCREGNHGVMESEDASVFYPSAYDNSDWYMKSSMVGRGLEAMENHHVQGKGERGDERIPERQLVHGSYLNLISKTWLCLSIPDRLVYSSLHKLDPYYASLAKKPSWWELWGCDILFALRGGTDMNLHGKGYTSTMDLKYKVINRIQATREVPTSIHRMFAKMRSELWIPAVRMLGWGLCKVFRLLFDGIHVDGGSVMALKERLKECGPNATLVLLPTHKTHLDYLILSFVCFAYGIPLPRIAAGINLNLPLVGSYLRQNGSFFIERSFKKQPPIYKALLKEYMWALMSDGAPIEVFIEGGRSRNGCVCAPKLGFLNILVNAFESIECADKMLMVPVSLDYERVLETPEYARHLLGKRKIPESLFGFLFSLYQIFTVRLGNAYVRFGTPIIRSKDPTEAPVEILAPIIAQQMQLASTITSSTLVTACLLMPHRSAYWTIDELAVKVDWILEDLEHNLKCHVSDFAPASEMVQHAVHTLENLLERSPDHHDSFRGRSGNPETSLQLSFYRNQIMHVYFLKSVMQCAVVGTFFSVSWSQGQKQVSFSTLLAHTKMLWNYAVRICQHAEVDIQRELIEFVDLDPNLHWFKPGPDFTTWICILEDGLIVHSKLSFWRTFLCSLLWPCLDSFYFFLTRLQTMTVGSVLSERDLIRDALSQARLAFESGRYHFSEFISYDFFDTALRQCIEDQILIPQGTSSSGQVIFMNPKALHRALVSWSVFAQRPSSRGSCDHDVLLHDRSIFRY